jgi:hypothetical protein
VPHKTSVWHTPQSIGGINLAHFPIAIARRLPYETR